MIARNPAPKLALWLAFVALCSGANAADLDAGREKSQTCQACHGVDGNGVGDPQYPIIAGQYAEYLIHTLWSYRDGKRNNPIMRGFAEGLSDEDIENLAAWFASQPSKLDDLSHIE